MTRDDSFGIPLKRRLLLVVRAGAFGLILGVLLAKLRNGSLDLDPVAGPLVLIGVAACFVYHVAMLAKWAFFSVELGERGIRAGTIDLAWADVKEVRARDSSGFRVLFEVRGKGGQVIRIPASIDSPHLILTMLDSHIGPIQPGN